MPANSLKRLQFMCVFVTLGTSVVALNGNFLSIPTRTLVIL